MAAPALNAVANTLSGCFSAINGISTARNWSVNRIVEQKTYGASNTDGGTARSDGRYLWGGQYAAYGAEPDVFPNDLFEFRGYTADTAGVFDGDADIWEGWARIQQVAITVDWPSGNLVSHVCTFVGEGELRRTEDSGYIEDVSNVREIAPEACSVSHKLWDGVSAFPGAWTPFTNVKALTFTLSADVKPFANSSTIQTVELLPRLTQQHTKGKVDWTLGITRESHRPATDNAGEGAMLQMTFGSEGDLELDFGKFEGISNIAFDIETGSIIELTENWAMTTHWDTVKGVIKMPSQTLPTKWWPNT